MFRNYRFDQPSFEQDIIAIVNDSAIDNHQLSDSVREIIRKVRAEGDGALIDYTARFDNFSVDDVNQLVIDKNELISYPARIDTSIAQALEQAVVRVDWFHQKQKEKSWFVEDEYGNQLGQRVMPLQRVGIYVPGGRASYPSSVIMNAIPAKVAGVSDIIMVMPTPNGELNHVALAAAAICGVSKVIRIGGAQAIAALAWGTETVPAVDKITGPGNAYVAEAKRQVFGRVGIDMIAGPSELVVISDATTNPEWIALDLCAQAEHDPNARSILLTDSQKHIADVQQAIQKHIDNLSTKGVIQQSLSDNGAFIFCRDIEQACEVSNVIAPEHVQLFVESPEKYESLVVNAGALFVGSWSCEVLGDYCAGPNHVLPTMASARFSSPLGVYDFTKRSSYIKCLPQGIDKLVDIADCLATAENFGAHAASARIRKTSQ